MTITEAAQTINSSQQIIFNAVMRGQLRATYNGKDFDIEWDDLLDAFGGSKKFPKVNEGFRNEMSHQMSKKTSDLDGYICALLQQIKEADQQIEELNQTTAKYQKYIQHLTEQLALSQQVIEEMKHRQSWWKRIFERQQIRKAG